MGSNDELYEKSVLDVPKLQRYARKVAKAAHSKVPMASHQEYVVRQRQEVRRKGWFSKESVTVSERCAQGPALRYWELGRVADETFRRKDGADLYGHVHINWTGVDDGSMIILLEDGELRHVAYSVRDTGPHYPVLEMETSHTEWKVAAMRPHDYLLLDRPNLGRMREKTYSRKSGLLYMEELRRNYRVTVRQKGLGLSLALNRLLKRAE
ncbi:hypothetical protein ACQ9AR_11660 [Streptomyces lividans]|uniref:Uncharacterized protein n=5 Tax=Streptomyces TaxID=1883 RepID=A0A7U9HBR2_STRLI|nr:MULTISPECIES: hypothetical protein [Streptomyces]QSJ11062.1 hypothetical protein SLIVDG2_22820 [Streptomyces lividans]WOZ00218.1 hypothetical protein R2E43_23305 [Streptomyces violaceoruber]BDD72533.1 hypothetical protein JCM4020_31530 [Streptomyces coelicolor]AIJ15492.1 hypothetical protein SLIV_22820 [Streptomyces lividans TK24]EFD68922.1 conserved hypothetical protein [Streptomyces lividans TK24]